jgi:hypothetical protein
MIGPRAARTVLPVKGHNAHGQRGVKGDLRAMSETGPLIPQQRRKSGHSLTSQMVKSRMGAVAGARWHRSVSHPRSSNRTCRFPASSSPTDFTERPTEKEPRSRNGEVPVWRRPRVLQGFQRTSSVAPLKFAPPAGDSRKDYPRMKNTEIETGAARIKESTTSSGVEDKQRQSHQCELPGERASHLQVAGRNLSDETPSTTLNAIEPCSDSGCRATVRPEPPTSTLAPPPTINPTSPDTPTYSPDSAP